MLGKNARTSLLVMGFSIASSTTCCLASRRNSPGRIELEKVDESNIVAWLLVSSESLVQVSSQSPVINMVVAYLHEVLEYIGVPEDQFPTPVTVCRSLIAIVCTLIAYYLIWGKRHRYRRARLAEELEVAKAQVNYLQDKLHTAKAEDIANETISGDKREVRIFMDGAFDMMHYGHMNAFRLGRSLGTHLVVGVNSDESITKCKGAPLMKDQERLTMVQSCKFVDEVVPGCPYIMNRAYLDYVIEKYKIDYVIHGDDVSELIHEGFKLFPPMLNPVYRLLCCILHRVNLLICPIFISLEALYCGRKRCVCCRKAIRKISVHTTHRRCINNGHRWSHVANDERTSPP